MNIKYLTSLIQLNTKDHVENNLHEYLSLLKESISNGSKFILSPEVTNCITTDHNKRLKIAKTLNSDIFITETKKICKDNGVWVLIGSLVMQGTQNNKCLNTSVLINPEGEIEATYDKIHMFDVSLSKKQTFKESDFYQNGEVAKLVKTSIGNIGLTICYDVRFPELYNKLALKGANILTVPSAFTKFTGKLHWETLLRARAIETGCYVLAPAQTGKHGKAGGRESFGHSMIISPWGEVLSSLKYDTGICTAEIDLSICDDFRRKIPSLANTKRIKF